MLGQLEPVNELTKEDDAVARPPSETLTGREAQIMDVVWRVEEATAEQVRAVLADPLHDSTVRTLLRVLVSKGYLAQVSRGKAFVYRAAIGRAGAQRHALGSVLARFFGGSAEDLVLRLIEDERLTPEQLDEIRRASTSSEADRRSNQGDRS
jgi:BlaI family transcriptional regulator, penicillinase repressor